MSLFGGKIKGKFIFDVLFIATCQVGTYYLVRYILRRLDPDYSHKVELEKKSTAILKRLESQGIRQNGGRGAANGSTDGKKVPANPVYNTPLTSYEQTILSEVVAPEDISVDFSSIGGLDDIIEDLREAVIFPLTSPHLFGQSSLLSAPKGVLLYGPPGCGKTMLAKALAKESGACFINLHISTLTEKWFGDSNKMVNAVFSLARRLQPAIIFIDEIDAVLRRRQSTDHEASAQVKAEFMTHWDGLLSATPQGDQSQILVLGATNRIDDIDEAILRRLPKKFEVPLPSATQRKRILQLILKDTKLSPDFDMDRLVTETEGMSGSDIKEACRDAAMVPVREVIKSMRTGDSVNDMRGVENTDFWKGPGNIRRKEIDELKQALQSWNDKIRGEVEKEKNLIAPDVE